MFSWNWLCFFVKKRYGFWGTVGTVFGVRLVRYGRTVGTVFGVRLVRYGAVCTVREICSFVLKVGGGFLEIVCFFWYVLRNWLCFPGNS